MTVVIGEKIDSGNCDPPHRRRLSTSHQSCLVTRCAPRSLQRAPWRSVPLRPSLIPGQRPGSAEYSPRPRATRRPRRHPAPSAPWAARAMAHKACSATWLSNKIFSSKISRALRAYLYVYGFTTFTARSCPPCGAIYSAPALAGAGAITAAGCLPRLLWPPLVAAAHRRRLVAPPLVEPFGPWSTPCQAIRSNGARHLRQGPAVC